MKVLYAWLAGLVLVFVIDRMLGRPIPTTAYDVTIFVLKSITTVITVVVVFRLVDRVFYKPASRHEE